MAELNFLPPKKVVLEQDKKIARQSLIFASAFLLLSVLVSGIIFLFSSYQQQRISALNADNEDILAFLEDNRQTIESLTNIHSKVLAIKEIFGLQFAFAPTFEKFFRVVPEGIGLDSISVDNHGEIMTSLTASGSAAISNLVAAVTAPEHRYANILLGEISLSKNSPIELSLGLSVASSSSDAKK